MKSIYVQDNIHNQLKFLSTLEKCSLSSLVERFLSKAIQKKLSDLPTKTLQNLTAQGGSFDFLKNSAEDLYSEKDGASVR